MKKRNPGATSCSIEGGALRDPDFLLLGVRYLLGPSKADHTSTMVMAGVRLSDDKAAPEIIWEPDETSDPCRGYSGISDIQVVDDHELLVLTSYELWNEQRCPHHRPGDTVKPIAEVGGALWLLHQAGRGRVTDARLVQRFAHKPEGLTQLPDKQVLVVFDDDGQRKSISRAPDTFPLEQNQSVFAIVDIDR